MSSQHFNSVLGHICLSSKVLEILPKDILTKYNMNIIPINYSFIYMYNYMYEWICSVFYIFILVGYYNHHVSHLIVSK